VKQRLVAEKLAPEVYGAVVELGRRISESGIDRALYPLIKIRASQINGCAFCIDLHTREARKRGEAEERIYALDAEALDALARRRSATAVLSVGLVPGLTNLLARHCADSLGGELLGVDISVLLGLGEAPGKEGVRWVVENLDKRFEATGFPGTVGSLEDPKTTLFPGGYGRRATYRFDFSDQHVLARTLGAGRAATRLCFDSAAATRLLAVLKKTGALRVLGHRWARGALVAVLSRAHFGSDGFAVAAEAEEKGGRRHSCSAWGRGQGHATGWWPPWLPRGS